MRVSTYESGNGTAGGDFEFTFHVLEGNAVASNFVDYFDYLYTRYAEGLDIEDPSYTPFYDIDGNGAIEQADWQEILGHLWSSLPSGTPPGSVNDAPTTIGFDLVAITDRVADVNVSLHDAFEDAEDADSALTYTIKSQTNSSLFDSVTVNSQTGSLVLNAASTGSGRSTIVLTATDTNGLSVDATLTVDVDYVNQAPVISEYVGVWLEGDFWEISGIVADADDNVEGLIVELSGTYGTIDTRVVVQEDGTFSFRTTADPSTWDWIYATTWDPHGEQSNNPSAFIGLT